MWPRNSEWGSFVAEATQYRFDLKEVITALIKQQGLKTGKWVLAVEFGLGAGVTGPSPAESVPSAIIQIKSLQLQAATPEAIETLPHLVVDASAI